MLNGASRKSLLIIDELGRGTSTADGYAIAFAVAGAIADRVSSFFEVLILESDGQFDERHRVLCTGRPVPLRHPLPRAGPGPGQVAFERDANLRVAHGRGRRGRRRGAVHV